MDNPRNLRRLTVLTQAAVDATATAYSEDAHVDVEKRMRTELGRRGIAVDDDEWMTELAHNIRSGHPVMVAEEEPPAD